MPISDRATPLEALPGAMACADMAARYDANRDGVFNVSDYACDSRVEIDPAARAARGQPRGVGPADLLDPQDVLIAFTDGDDDDGNGFEDDMVGWDFLDDDNDPYDDVQYGHGTGEARDSTAEANNRIDEDNATELATCPNCMSVHMRVGDSVRGRREPLRPGCDLRRRQRRAGGAVGAGHPEQLQPLARRGGVRIRPRRDDGGVGRGRGRPAQQPAAAFRTRSS